MRTASAHCLPVRGQSRLGVGTKRPPATVFVGGIFDPTGENPCDKCYKSMDHYRVDDFIEYALSKRGKENLALTFLAVGCIAGIAVIHRL